MIINKFLFLISLSLLVFVNADSKDDLVQSLDGYVYENFKMYSGYLQLQADPVIKVHYLFVTSQDKPETDDVILWSNGGPGCSSLIGFAQQNGPNMIYSGSKKFATYANPYSWNKHANVLYFESPPGVGFSINNDPNYVFNESRTASDSVLALQKWFQKFSQFKANNFWISGQSYCGMYIPNFASALIDANNAQQVVPGDSINFKGVMIGNGVMVTQHNWRRKARNTFYSNHYFYGPEINKLLSYCRYTDDDKNNPLCLQGQDLADRSVEMINPYATIGTCYTPPKQKMYGRRRYWYTPFFEQNNPIMSEAVNGGACTDDFNIANFFNSAKIKDQLHVSSQFEWETCNSSIGENYHKDNSSIQIFQKLKDNNIKILLFSGNTDAVVSYVETEEYIRQIGWSQKSNKIQFKNKRDSLLGWKTQYDGLTLVIINGAGHMVPEDKPHAAYEMIMNFIKGDTYTETHDEQVREENVEIVVQ